MNAAPIDRLRRRRLVLGEAGGWRPSLARLGVLAAVWAMLFHADLADLVRVWLTSTPYSHCVFLPPIIAWLVWQRRAGLLRLEPRPWWPGLAWLALGALLWLFGWAAGVALLRHAALVVTGQALVLAMLGPAVGRALAFPLFYAFFMIPVGTEAEPAMQIITARMAVQLLWLSGVPAEIAGIFITTPNGHFRVAEACSGTGFLIAMAAFSTLVAHLCFKSLPRRVLFVAMAMTLCLLANSMRAFGIIFIAYHSSVDSAVVVDHVLYGWLFFAAVIVLAMVIGWPFHDRSPHDPWFDPARLQGAVEPRRGIGWGVPLAATALMVAPVAWSVLSRSFSASLPHAVEAPQVPGWTREATSPLPSWQPHFTGADRMLVAHYRDGGDRAVDLAIVQFAWQEDGKELVGFGQGAAAPDGEGDWTWSAPAAAPAGARGDMLAGPRIERRMAWTWYRVGGVLTGRASRVKLETLKLRLLGRDQRAAAIIASALVPPGPDGAAQATRTLADFSAALGPVEELADRGLAID